MAPFDSLSSPVKRAAAVVLALCAAFVAGGLRGDVIPVAAGGDIATAVASAADGDVVELAAGTFTLSAEISLTGGITVKGAGRSLTRVVSDGGSHRLFTLNNASAVLSDMTLSGGKVSGSGGAVNLSNGTVRDLVIRDCSASGHGGGIHAVHGTISRVMIFGCRATSASSQGGGINCAASSNPAIDNVLATGCEAQWGGGAYYDGSSSVTVRNCSFLSNRARAENGQDTYYYAKVTAYNVYEPMAYLHNTASSSTRIKCLGYTDATWFLGWSSGNFRIGAASALAGKGDASVGALVDLAGRPFGASVAVGPFQPLATEGTRLDLSANEVAFGGSLTITPHLATATGTLLVVDDTAAAQTLAVSDGVGAVWTPSARGAYSLALKDADGQKVVDLYHAVFVGEGEVHVNGTTTWDEALASVIDGGIVWLDDGEYVRTSPFTVNRPLTVRSVNGRDKTVIQANGCGAIVLQHPLACVRDLTLRGNSKNMSSSGVSAYAGTVEACTIERFSSSGKGAAVYAAGTDTRIERCIIRDNAAVGYAGGACVDKGCRLSLRNTLFYGNSAAANWGADVYADGEGQMVNCTLADVPTTKANGSLCRCNNAFAVTNCLMRTTSWYSGAVLNLANNISSCDATIFANAEDRDYRLAPTATSAIDQGLDAVVSATEKDALGAKRISGEHVDIGACEYSVGEFSASFELQGTASAVGDVVTLVPVIVNGNAPVNRWRIDNLATGTSVSAETYGNGAVGAYAYTVTSPGVFSFYYDVTDGEDTASASRKEAVTVKTSGDVTVAVAGTPTAPFDTPTTALTNLSIASRIVPSTATITILEGTHLIDARVTVPKDGAIVGAGVDRTTVTCPQDAAHGFFTLNGASSRLSGLTVTGAVGLAYSQGAGIGIRVDAGRVEDVRIAGVRTASNNHGAAIALMGGQAFASRLLIENCTCAGFGTVYMALGGHIDNSLVRTSVCGYGHCLYSENGTATNCTFIGRDDKVHYDVWGGGGKIVNCIISGYAQTSAREIVSDRFYNCAYSCTDLCEPEGTENGNFRVTDFGFVDAAKGDYHLKRGAAPLGRGRVADWMKSATDLDGNRRLSSGRVDIGCYQRAQKGLVIIITDIP